MKQKLFAILTILALTLSVLTFFSIPSAAASFSLWDGTVADGFAGGDGSEANPFRIASADQLAFLSKSVAKGNSYEGKYIVLTSNIQLNAVKIGLSNIGNVAIVSGEHGSFRLELGILGDEIVDDLFEVRGMWTTRVSSLEEPQAYPDLIKWEPIGNEKNPFNGNFDGYGHTISGVYCNQRDKDYIGLFGFSQKGIIQNLRIEDSFFCGKNYVGSLLGQGNTYHSPRVINCYSSATISGLNKVGGLIGFGTIADCTFEGCVSGETDIGGICGSTTYKVNRCNYNGYAYGKQIVGGIVGTSKATIQYCNSDGKIWGKEYAGGIVGKCTAAVTYCHNSANITGESYLGGICGYFPYKYADNLAHARYCYSEGRVNGSESYIGGIAGYGQVYDSYNLNGVSGKQCCGGIVGYGTANGCENFGSVSGKIEVGGICGRQELNVVKQCRNSGSIHGEHYVGGIVGYGTALNCGNLSNVTGGTYVGGIVGAGSVALSYNEGSIAAGTEVGGIVGTCLQYVRTCYNIGTVTGNKYVGGIVGNLSESDTELPKLLSCYYLKDCATDYVKTFQNAIGAEAPGTATPDPTNIICVQLTEEEMKSKEAYTVFDFETGWSIDNDAYPIPQQLMHTEHSYTLQNVSDQTLCQKATCQNPATYYYRCDCGFLSFETFEAGEALSHDITDDFYGFDMGSHWHICRLCAAENKNQAHTWDEEKATFVTSDNFKYLSLFCSTCSNEIRIDLPYSLQVPGQDSTQTPQLPGIPTTQEVDTTYQTIQTIFFFVMGCVVGGFALYGFYTVKEMRRQLQEAKNKQNKQNGRYP